MARKKNTPLDFSLAGEQDAGPPQEATATLAPEDDADLDIAAPEPEPEPSPIVHRETGAVARQSGRQMLTHRNLPPPPAKAGGWMYLIALFVSIAWGAAPLAYFQAQDVTPFSAEPFALAVLIMLVVGPIALFWTLAFVLNQGARLAAEARFARAQAEDMIHPAAIAAAGAGGAVELIRDQIEQAVAAAAQARHELITLREVLASETAHLAQATASSAETAVRLTRQVGEERRELTALSEVLKAQTDEVENSITRQSALVAQAADLADAKIREAEARLTASASDLSAASGEASSAAKAAGEDLSRQAARLEAAGVVIVEQVRNVEDGLAEQRAALVTVAHELRAEQEGFGAEVETRQAQLSAILSEVRSASADIVESAGTGSEALKTLVENAADRFRDLGEAAAQERDIFSSEVLKSVGAISEAARNERELLVEEATATMESLNMAAAEATNSVAIQSEAAKAKVEALNEAARDVGQVAEAAFDARLAQARDLIERSAALVEEAGVKASERLAEGLKSAHATVDRLQKLLGDVDARAAKMPAEAEQRQAEVRAVVEKGVEELLGAARRAADETQAIDQAFQERVRRNYEMLSEAVRLMGVVGGSGASPRPSRLARPASLGVPPTPEAREAAPAPRPAHGEGLRTRLRLTPDAEDEEVFAPEPNAPSAEDARELTWKEILSHADETEEDGALSMLDEIRQLGIDPTALLPKSRIEEIAPILQSGDRQGAREVVRQLAPAAMRRLSRRILSDDALKPRTYRFIKDFDGQIEEAAADHRDGFAVAALLSSDEGRAFLLVDAALADT